jgi:hypothetical protein
MDTVRVPKSGTPRARVIARDGPLTAALVGLLVLGVAMTVDHATPSSVGNGTANAAYASQDAETDEPGDDPGRSVPGHKAGPLTLEEIKGLYSAQAKKPLFDGSVMGWRIAPYPVLLGEGLDNPYPSLSCEGRHAGGETTTDLDFVVTYLPPDLPVKPGSEPDKGLCGSTSTYVALSLSVESAIGAGQIWIERSVQSRRTLELEVPNDSVEKGTINGTPAILVHPADDETGLGMGLVVVLEDDVEPEFMVLKVFADDAVPFAELVKIAEGVK